MSNDYNINKDYEWLIKYHIDEYDPLHVRQSDDEAVPIYVAKRGIPKDALTRDQFLDYCKSIGSENFADMFPFIDINRIWVMYVDNTHDIFRLTCRKNGVNIRISDAGLKIMYNRYQQYHPLDIVKHLRGKDIICHHGFPFPDQAPIQIDFHKAFTHRMVNAVMLCMMLDDGIQYRQCVKHLKRLTEQSIMSIMQKKKLYEKRDFIKHDSEIARYFKSRLNPKAHEELMDLFWLYCVNDPI